MGVTYTTAADRDLQRAPQAADRPGPAYLSLALTSAVAILAIVLSYAGRMSVFEQSEAGRGAAEPVNLNTVADATRLEPALGAVLPNANDRRFAAEALFRFLTDERKQERPLSHVGALARASVEAQAIDETTTLDVFRQRLERSRQNAAAAGRPAPGAIAVLSASDLAALKPSLTVRTPRELRRLVLLWACLFVLAFHLPAAVWWLRGVRGDHLLLAAAHLLAAIGFAALLSRPDPLRDSVLFARFAEGTIAGLVVMTAVSLVDFDGVGFAELSYLPLAGALALSLLLIVFGSGPGSSSAKVNLGPMQPIEAIRLLLALFLAGYFARRWELLRGVRSRNVRDWQVPGWINLPRGEYAIPVLAGVGLALLFFFLQKDLGPALFLCCVFLAVYAVARGRAEAAFIGLGLLVLGFFVGNRLHISPTLADRVRMWQSPWDNAIAGGDQLTRAVWGMATGGWFGTGLGLGDTRYLPAGHTDLILAAVGEEIGAAGLTIVAALYVILAWRGLRIARLARNDYGFFLATALTLFLIVPSLIMASGILAVTPLTGVVTPFLSYGGSAMVANFCAIGMMCAIHADRHPPGDFEPFRLPVRWLQGALGLFAVALLAVTLDVQVVHADDYVARPHLGVQADGGRRFEYNPRVLDVLRLMPRGTIYDRHGLPLATDDPRAVASARPAYAKLGISLATACPESSERCYPLGGRTFHLLGDIRTHINWGATNTSYVERDAEDRLRGFDDHATAVHTTDAAGRSMLTIRRDYRQLVPALRHRYDMDNTALARLRSQPRDVRLTIDANLQVRVAAIVASYAQKAAGRAAAVVIDPDTGDLLASASFPWPVATSPGDSVPENAGDSLLDRARYGLYPPGSTFKLVTASAALRQNINLCNTALTCVRLPDGRVGARIAGWNRPVRDDVLDTEPHGTITMHDGFVHSCNAYFAQLAVKLGPKPLLDTANRLGISLMPKGEAPARVQDMLPQAGYGQGEVVTSPLRMARTAAAVASNGALRDTRWDRNGAEPPAADQFLSPDAARLLGGYMRDVVSSGTGRALRNNPWRIAGKTGTAELSGQPSHSWFVGFAPFGPATKRVAFAVLVENAGYGGGSAAPAAGEIVGAAALAGLIK